MIKAIGFFAAFVSGATTVYAGGLERTPQSPAILFEDGRTVELSFGIVSPDVSGEFGGAASGDIFSTFVNLGAAFKADLNDTWSYAIIFDQPYGADTDYPVGTANVFTGTTADVNSNAISGILQYNFTNGASVFGGLRAQTLQAEASIPFLPPVAGGGGYEIESGTDLKFGYLAGVAYERPDIALRVSLTYHSAVDHDLDLTETHNLLPGPVSSIEEVTLPQALNLEFQTGVAEDTLLFGSVRWVEWSETVINPAVYSTLVTAAPLVFFSDDRLTYTLGMGRRLNETWSILGSISHENTTGSVTGNLGPIDGFTSLSVGAVYRRDNMRITGGIRYADVGDATSFSGANFTDNSAVAAGVRVGWTF